MLAKIILLVCVVSSVWSKFFRGSCPIITAPNVNYSFIGSIAIYTIPMESPSADFDFYVKDEDILQDNQYFFYNVEKYLSWNFKINQCPYHPALSFNHTVQVFDKNIFLVEYDIKYDNRSVCEIDKWMWNVIIEDPEYPNLLLIMGCIELNSSFHDLAAWVILHREEHENNFTTESQIFYKNLTKNIFSISGFNSNIFESTRLLLGRNLASERPENSIPNLCYSNVCETNTGIFSENVTGNMFIKVVWAVYALIIVLITVLAIKFI